MWGDSDILYLQQMTSPKHIEAIISRDVSFTKIGTKITETSQLLDLGPHFNILNGRHITSVWTETLISVLVAIQCKELRKTNS